MQKYIIRFIEKDGKSIDALTTIPLAEALNHIPLLASELSVIYKRIEIIKECSFHLPYLVFELEEQNTNLFKGLK